ncbi:hypothetical protein OVY01_15195 [Robbsia sp. Bb-Pol-6]|uniref:Uncharacterized protein n=1 Tax=Robbsia betulipollinis TaxID=2981849 RepID=A0ABT3ZPR7_9BURK|nr:hypothetical protein [Robbsia betulipollinis]MCY0388534.1 hypothetical protein [Robbsia betulipollinis]
MLLLANAPAAMRRMSECREIPSTLAVSEIREHGHDKALQRFEKTLAAAQAGGKTRITKKDIAKTESSDRSLAPAPSVKAAEIAAATSAQATSSQVVKLVAGRQCVLRDPAVGNLLGATIEVIRDALLPFASVSEPAPSRNWRRKVRYRERKSGGRGCSWRRTSSPICGKGSRIS